MRMTGIVFLILGGLFLLAFILSLVLPDGRDDNVPFLSNTWSPILASFFLPAGAALLIASKRRKRPHER